MSTRHALALPAIGNRCAGAAGTTNAPGWPGPARAARLPGAAWALERGERLFLHGSPALQRWVIRRGRPVAPRHPG